MSDLFKVHKLNPNGLDKANRMREVMERCLTDLTQIISQQSDEYRIGCQKLEEASFYFKKAMAIQKLNQE